MEIIEIKDYKERRFQTVVALGNFDGVHKGHCDLIQKMTQFAEKNKLKSALLVFDNHTKTILTGNAPKTITSMDQKYKIFENLQVELIYKMKFNNEIMKLLPEQFVKEVLIDNLNVKAVVVGFDYRFGYKASGNAQLLKELGNKYNFTVIIIDPIYIDNQLVSSSKIRELLLEGNIMEANKLLGRNYSIIGRVVPGKKLGNRLGFPTANIEPIENYVIPKNGVYSTNTIVDNKSYLSATSIGSNPTFKNDGLKIESHIIDFDQDIYDKIIELEFVEYLRGEIKFQNIKSLKKRVQADIKRAKMGQP